ncbi:cytoplasmic tRNA 2-thiolation protein 2 isoform X1 [Chiroxiphia lanceolata]|uniref:cytoplasmic tRNA 2-thiolation protein 2 isoform X1 n=1 Tax=Chiroxiphia lanceolata TaxID=296741 RepID=UPI0013CE40DC|nr:cytoplasmic tRNA 2-thiolation protein 2 isoform X1 [Chiroxiphia lanceolata]
MCDVSGDGGGCGADAEPPRRRRAPRDSHPRTCMKCGQGTAALIIRVGDPFCRGCFREYFVHKFRAMLGKNRVIFPGEKVLLALSGGSASSAMVRQVQEGLSREAAKRLRFIPGLVYVEEGAVRRQSPEQREQTLTHMETLLRATGFPYYLIHLEEALELPPSILQPGPEQSSKSGSSGPSYKEAVDSFIQQKRQEGEGDSATSLPGHSTQDMPVGPPYTPRLPDTAQTQELLRIFEAVETATAREELLQMLRTHLILQMARSRGYSKVMTGETCTRVAIKLLTNLSLGRGAFLAVDTGFTDKRHGDVMVVRPMRDYTAKEIAFYNHFFNIPTVIVPPLFTKRREKPSIHHLIERFLLGLQEDFPSTISTVYRTGEKLSPDPAKASSESQRCLLCLCGLDIEGGKWVGHGGLRGFEEQLCTPQLPPCPLALAEEELALEPTLIWEELEPVGNGCCQQGAESKAAYIPLLCYSCRLTFKELGPLTTLPPYMRAEAQRRIHSAEMAQQTQENQERSKS